MSDRPMIKVKQIGSGIGRPVSQKRILEALGLGRMQRVVELPDNAAIRGMVAKIPHLVVIVDEPDAQARG